MVKAQDENGALGKNHQDAAPGKGFARFARFQVAFGSEHNREALMQSAVAEILGVNTVCAMSREQLSSIIATDQEVQGGAPVFRGTRVPVQSLFDHLEAGESIDDFLEGFSTVTREQVIGLLELLRQDALASAA